MLEYEAFETIAVVKTQSNGNAVSWGYVVQASGSTKN
jgi:hypothetical protein